MQTTSPARCIPGTTLFDADQARKGYALNKMCFSFNNAAARQEFQQDEAAYCARFGLNAQQTGLTKDQFQAKLYAAAEA